MLTRRTPATFVLLLCFAASAGAQAMASLQGRVVDASGSALARATITVINLPTGFRTTVLTDSEGRFYVAAIPAGSYEVTAAADGFRSSVLDGLVFEVGRTVVRDFRLEIGGRTEAVVVRAEPPLLDRATSVVGHMVPSRTIQDAPLNGRHFVDLGPLVPGSVTPSQTGFSTTPLRGTGALAFNTAGNREEAVGYLVNGVTTNNLTFGSIGFPPPVASIEEFKVDNSTFSAEYGHVSGAIVNLVTRSGTDRLGGEAYEYFRDEALDAKNYFEFTSPEPHPFRRSQFGGAMGGPIIRSRLFFYATFEGLRQRQGIDLNTVVPSDAQRAAVTHPSILRLLPLIPRANYFDADGTSRFVGAADAFVDENTWTADVRDNAGARDRLQVFVGRQQIRGGEPGASGTSIPGFGQKRSIWKGTLTVNETHSFGPGLLNEARFGLTGQDGSTFPAAALNPEEYGIGNGVDRPIGLPQLIVAGALNFGGPASLPQGRRDVLTLYNDTVTWVSGRHSVRAGGEFRRFRNDNFAEGTGQFNFPSMTAFLSGTASAFSITLGERRSRITQDAVSFFGQDSVRLASTLTVDLGLRYEWHVTPTERDDQFVVFDAATSSLVRVGVDVERIYRQNNRNLEPRVGLAWAPGAGGRTVIRGAWGAAVDQPGTTAVRDTAGNPPFATPLSASGAVAVQSAVTGAMQPARLAPVTIDPGFRNASLRSWNINVQRQLASDLSLLIGYFGSRGRNLRISRNLNQPVNGVVPFPSVSASSPIRPGAPLGNITQVESSGFSRYTGLWLSVTKRWSRQFSFDASYTLSKSEDTNSLNSSGFAVQNGYDIPGELGLSDFDARHRFVTTATWQLPFTGHALTRGWQVGTIVQAQSGNPVNIVTTTMLNGVPNTVRPDLVGPIVIVGSVDQWFDPAAFAAVPRFGNLGRNVVIGPNFINIDLSVMKTLTLARTTRVQLRVDVFDVFNRANLGPPGNVVGSPMFGKISRTRLPTGEAGSSRQVQLVAKVVF